MIYTRSEHNQLHIGRTADCSYCEQFQTFIDNAIKSNPTEARIIRKVIREFKKAGNPIVAVYDGDEDVMVRTERDILECVFNLDDAYLVTKSGGWVRLIMGNWQDVITDYSTSLDPVMDGIIDYVNSHSWS